MNTITAVDRGLSPELAADLAGAALMLARRFAAGATMWSIAPSWEPHAMHIAVEFVHPVIMGKRALPAVALTGPELVDLVRVSVRPGDIVVAVSDAGQPDVRSVMHRSPAWGATTIWIGSGQRPPGRCGRPRAVARRPRPTGSRHGRLRALLPRVVGVDPCVFRASGIAAAERLRMRRRDMCYVQRRRPPREVVTASTEGWPKCAPHKASRTWRRRWSTRSPLVIWCWCTRARR